MERYPVAHPRRVPRDLHNRRTLVQNGSGLEGKDELALIQSDVGIGMNVEHWRGIAVPSQLCLLCALPSDLAPECVAG